jgi:chemotaxis protein methyltransferase CheR
MPSARLSLTARRSAAVEALEIVLLLEGVLRRYGFDFRDYARGALRRRLLECARSEKARTISGLQEKILHDPECFERLVTAISSNVTTLFRNPSFYRTFRSRVAPVMRESRRVRLWHVGCATGEEVYSMAVTLQEEGLSERTQVYATDLHEAPIVKAAEGAFPRARLEAAELSYKAAGGKGRLSDYYTLTGSRGVFRPELRRNVVFASHNVTTDSSFNEFDAILCRNVLPYLNGRLQGRVHQLIYESLARTGFLGLGRGEDLKLTPFEPCYLVVDAPNALFQKLG